MLGDEPKGYAERRLFDRGLERGRHLRGKLIERAAQLLGLTPRLTRHASPFPLMAAARCLGVPARLRAIQVT